MSALKEIAEIGKSILKGSTIIVGTKRLAAFADRAIPVAAGRSREAWERIKNTKSTGKSKGEEKPLFEDDDEESETSPDFTSQEDTDNVADAKDKKGDS